MPALFPFWPLSLRPLPITLERPRTRNGKRCTSVHVQSRERLEESLSTRFYSYAFTRREYEQEPDVDVCQVPRPLVRVPFTWNMNDSVNWTLARVASGLFLRERWRVHRTESCCFLENFRLSTTRPYTVEIGRLDTEQLTLLRTLCSRWTHDRRRVFHLRIIVLIEETGAANGNIEIDAYSKSGIYASNRIVRSVLCSVVDNPSREGDNRDTTDMKAWNERSERIDTPLYVLRLIS